MALNCDPSALANAATCFDKCISPGEQPAVETYLLSLIAGGSTDPATLLNNARCFHSCIPKGEQLGVQTYLMAVIGKSSLDPSVLLNAATCFRSCIPQQEQPAVTLYILANKAGASPDPATLANLARCFSSCIPKGSQRDVQTYLLAVKAGLSGDPSALANTARCFSTCIPRGAQTAVQNYILCNFFFNIVISGGEWADRVVINGGAMPSQNTISAIDTMLASISSLQSRIYHLNIIAPDSIIAMSTPLINKFGSDPWTLHQVGTGGGVLNLNGWQGTPDDTNGGVWDTGVDPSSIPSFGVGNGGMSAYMRQIEQFDVAAQVGAKNAAATQIFNIYAERAGDSKTSFTCYDNTTDSTVLIFGNHFESGNRTAQNSSSLYQASGIQPFTLVASSAINNTAMPPSVTIAFGGDHFGNIYRVSGSILSFFAVHDGFNAADAQTLFNAAQALRVALGGGFE